MPGRDRYSPDSPPTAIAGIVEIIKPGNTVGSDDNWKIDISTGDFIIAKKESGTWIDASKLDAPST